MTDITIIGIDPGSRATGYGIIKFSNHELNFVDCGVIHAIVGNMSQRLQKIYQGLTQAIDLHQPHEAAIEKVFTHLNPKGALILGQARGVALLAVAQIGIQLVEEYTARRVKQSVVGYGAANKEQVQFMVKTLLKLHQDIPFDAADALAIAICHAHSRSENKATDIIHPQLRTILAQYPKGWRRGRK